MGKPASQDQFIDYCKRRLGWPVIQVELEEGQIADRLDDAIQKWQEYHFDGVERHYLSYLLTQTDIDNRYIPVSDPLIISVLKVLPLNQTTINMFDVRYQVRLNDFYNFNNVSMIHYYMTMNHLALLDFLFNVQPAIRFNRKDQKIFLEADWTSDFQVGQYIVFECYRAVDPTSYNSVWNDAWLKEYATALLKRQWGDNLKKYGAIQMPGGITLNGQQIFNEAYDEITKLEAELSSKFELPIDFFCG